MHPSNKYDHTMIINYDHQPRISTMTPLMVHECRPSTQLMELWPGLFTDVEYYTWTRTYTMNIYHEHCSWPLILNVDNYPIISMNVNHEHELSPWPLFMTIDHDHGLSVFTMTHRMDHDHWHSAHTNGHSHSLWMLPMTHWVEHNHLP